GCALNVHLRRRTRRDVDSIVGETEDFAVLHKEGFTSQKPDAIDSASDTVDPEIPQDHHVRRSGLDNDAVGTANQYRGHLASAAVNCNSLGDSDRAVAGRIQGVNLTAQGGLGDGAGKSLAWCCAAARVGIVADARYPRTAGLPVHHGRGKYNKR